VCPHSPIAYTCQTNTGVNVWNINDNGNTVFLNSMQRGPFTLGDFTIQLTHIDGSVIETTATGIVTDNVTVTCSTGSVNSISTTISTTTIGQKIPFNLIVTEHEYN
jgi:hypothetical protein